MGDINHFEEPKEERDSIFNFLPEGAYPRMLAAFAFALFRGMEIERFDQIASGVKPTPEEQEILEWVYKIAVKFADALAIKDDMDTSNAIMDDARQIASLYLDEETIDKAIYISILRVQSSIDPNLVTEDDYAALSYILRKKPNDDLINYN